jgi:uncharacterized protein (TIGR03435 family)
MAHRRVRTGRRCPTLIAGALAAVVFVSLALAAQGALRAQAPSASFDVASVKVNNAGGPSSVRAAPNGTLTVTNNTLRNIVRNAYGITNTQIVGGPDWFDAEHFDINAKAAAPFNQVQGMAMLRALLADRFKLAAHMETRELPIYALTLARSDGRLGPQMKRSDVDCAALFAAVQAGGRMPPAGPNGALPCGLRMQPGTITGSAVAMEQLARNLVGGVGRIVVDKTGLAGFYDIDVTFSMDSALAPPPGQEAPRIDPAAPSLFTALQEQLGLKLDAQRGPVDVLVIDRAERPSAD